jgi:S-adenosylmethionine:tRNA ribosyltransferase-isomerase
LYWLGCQVVRGGSITGVVGQWEPYEQAEEIPTAVALQALLDELDRRGDDTVQASTQLLIAPGYRIRTIQGIITNFHQPESTLLLLISALIGDNWRRVYEHALANNYRFLSYGDSSLLIP